MRPKYEKPQIKVLSETSEGVFAASGDTSCWSVSPGSVQEWNGSHHVFEVRCVHAGTAQHVSSDTTVTMTFNSPVVDAYAEFPTSYSGNTVTVKRTLLGDAYKSGDTVSYKVWVKAGDEAATRALACTGANISCNRAQNVQGGID